MLPAFVLQAEIALAYLTNDHLRIHALEGWIPAHKYVQHHPCTPNITFHVVVALEHLRDHVVQ
jgi:hypothetical protein